VRSDLYQPPHEEFRETCRDFLTREALPHHDQWERDGIVSRDFWLAAGKAGLLGMGVPSTYGGGDNTDYRYPAVLSEELVRAGVAAPGIVAHNDVVASYLARITSDEQRSRWLPGLCSGELVAAIALTEPSGGSDVAEITTAAVADGDGFVLNGTKTLITNGERADVMVVAARTEREGGTRGISLFVVERDTVGLSRGERMPKLGWHASDVCELRFENCRIPATNLLGKEGAGSAYLMAGMPRERLSIAVVAVATAEKLLALTLSHARSRHAFGQPIGSLQHNRFLLSTLDTEVDIARLLVDHAIAELNEQRLTVADAAKAKWWTTELQKRTVDACLQLHGGYGYMLEYPISRAYVDARIQTIYGGTTEIMKEIIGRGMGV
jgi:acyl-CoA dehydrogenase